LNNNNNNDDDDDDDDDNNNNNNNNVFWDVSSCNVAVGYHCFGGPCCPHLQDEMNDDVEGAEIQGESIKRMYR
jgi:hypothetical protein